MRDFVVFLGQFNSADICVGEIAMGGPGLPIIQGQWKQGLTYLGHFLQGRNIYKNVSC